MISAITLSFFFSLASSSAVRRRSPVYLLESRGAVFEEFLLPAIEQAGFQAMGIAVVRHRLPFQQVLPEDGYFLLWREFPPNLLGHVVLHE